MAATRCGFLLVATALSGQAFAQAFTTAPPDRFEAAFAETGSVPTFARPEVTSLLAGSVLAAQDETAVEQNPSAPAEPPRRWSTPAAAVRASLSKVLHELLITPAESAPSEPAPVVQAEAPPAPPEVVPAPPEVTGSVEPARGASNPAPAATLARVAKPGRRIAVTRAAWYQHPGRTASGDKYNPDGLTAAHRTLPLGKRVLVVNADNKKSVVVRINDRVPRTAKFPLDLSRGSARAIGMTGIGTVALYEVN